MLKERGGSPADPLFPNARGAPLSRAGIEYLVAKHARVAKQHCPSLERKRISPHVLRHTAAMDLFLSGVDRTVIALWLGHENLDTTQIYLDANMELKEKALARTTPRTTKSGRFLPGDRLLEFLKNL